MSTTAPWTPPEWAEDYCKDYVLFLFSAGKWTLIAGVLLGIALAVATIYLLVHKPATKTEGMKVASPASATAVLEAAKAFLQALSSAPTWLALFGCGILLLWLSSVAAPESCKPPSPAGKGASPAPTTTTTPSPQPREPVSNNPPTTNTVG